MLPYPHEQRAALAGRLLYRDVHHARPEQRDGRGIGCQSRHSRDGAAHVRNCHGLLGHADPGVCRPWRHAGELAVAAAAFRWVGAAWLAVLAWQIATAPPSGEGGRGRVLGFFGAAAFQWIDPKAWLIAAAAAGEYLLPDRPLPGQLARSSSCSCWSVCHACWCGRLSAVAPAGCCIRRHACAHSTSPWRCCLSPRWSRC